MLGWVCVTRHAQSTQNKFPCLCNISRKEWGMKLIFCLKINSKVFYKLIASLWVRIARLAWSTQNSKFTISLQYLKEKVKDEVDLLPADKHLRLLQIDTVILGVCGQACQNYTKLQVCYFFAMSSRYSHVNWKSTDKWSLMCFRSVLKVLHSNYL